MAALASVVYVPAAAAMALNSLSARHFRERNWHAAAPTALTGVAFMLVPLGVRRGGPVAGIALIVVAAMGAWAVSGEPSSPCCASLGKERCRKTIKGHVPPLHHIHGRGFGSTQAQLTRGVHGCGMRSEQPHRQRPSHALPGPAGPVWSWPAAFVPPHGGARATAIAIFNIFGAVGGFIGPTLLGKLSDASGDYSKAMLVLGAMDLASALMFLGAPRAHGST